ncbi:Catenin-beta-like protein [Microdochium trichocladiopsis]|uniref:Catenin-beta-like protein n=1 Tax=Microdochium trichocladiopsis TaxID=1682393 RepID=A0A9P8Y6E9_9PEZI|nr:Catenin-beta-like protein [Microdochium trichocladiopsis]KAH7030778.1 Catenin-beta-like protein [Microdochium trichocladiopsis]
MTSIDDLFKAHSNKRKLEPLRNPEEVYKSRRLTPDGHSDRQARVDNHSEHDGAEDDTAAGPALPTDDYGPDLPPDDGDDDEGRFFGGGITTSEARVLDYVEGGDDVGKVGSDRIDSSWLRRTALNFEKRVSKNAELRAKFESDPRKFIQSEADLDADIKALSILAEHPELYPEFAKLGCVATLVSLLAHENTDIAIDAIEIVNEFTDEDVNAAEPEWNAMVDALLEADLLGLLVSNLERLDESEEVDRNGIYYAMSIIENLCSRTGTAEQVAKNEKLLRWLLKRAQRKETNPPVSQNKQYAAEILAILVQSSSPNRRVLASLDAADIMLQLVAAYRKRDPEKGGEEEEYMENLFEALTCVVDEPEGKLRFVEAEGVELCLIMLKEGKLSKAAALRLLDHAVGGATGFEVCQKVVEAGGLKTIFTMFMKKSLDGQTAEHLVGILASLLRLLPAESPERIRTLAKFVEKNYEKTIKLVQLRRTYAARMAPIEQSIRMEQSRLSAEEKEEAADGWFLRRLDAGLYALQTLDVVLAWLVAEDDGARSVIEQELAERDETLAVIRNTLQEQLDGMDTDDAGANESRDMLSALLQFVQ